MKYWISITSYLWKNIWSRWFESPLSAISKILLTFLLSLLALILVGIMRQTEQILEERLTDTDILIASASISAEDFRSPNHLQNSLYTEAKLKRLIDAEEIDFLRKVFIVAKEEKKLVTILVSFGTPSFWQEEWGEFSRPTAYLFSRKGAPPILNLTLEDIPLDFETLPLPKILEGTRGEDHFLLLPYPAGEPLLKAGFTEFFVFKSGSISALEDSLKRVEAFLSAERYKFTLDSSLSILQQMQNFLNLQKYIRIGLVSMMITIIAIVLGNQAFLEFREQQYHYSLIRSFGVPYFLIIWNDLLEKTLLSVIGFFVAYSLIPNLEKFIGNLSPQFSSLRILLQREDLYLIGGGVFAGVLLSWLFLSLTSKKQVGLVLS